MAALNNLRRRCRSESGAELIEFALTLPLLLLVVLGIIEFGFLFQQYEVVTNAAREGARIAVLPTYSPQDAVDRATQYLTTAGLDATLATIPAPVATSAPLPGGTCITTVQMFVSYRHNIQFVGGIISYFGSAFPSSINLRAWSTMRTEGAAGTCP